MGINISSSIVSSLPDQKHVAQHAVGPQFDDRYYLRSGKTDTNRLRGKRCLVGFLIVGWMAASSSAAAMVMSENAGRMLNLFAVALYPLLLAGAFFYYERSKNRADRPWKGYITAFIACYCCLVAYGFLIGNSWRVRALDTVTLATVFGAFYLGRRDEVWEDAKLPVIFLTALSIVLSLVYTDSYVLVDRGILNSELGSQFETGLTLAPLFCIMSVGDRKLWRYYVLLLLSSGCLFVYLYFGRRGVSTRCFLEILCAAVILPSLLGMFKRVRLTIVMIGAFAVALLVYFPFDTLISRFVGSYGVVDTVTVDNERFIEQEYLLKEFSVWEMFVGRGIGGAFLINQEKTFVLDKIDATRSGRIVLHAGAWYPFLKGGAVFQLIYFLPLFLLMRAVFRWKQLDVITKATILAGGVMFPFQFIEGSPTYATPWVAFGIGLIMSRAQNAVEGLRGRPHLRPQRHPRKSYASVHSNPRHSRTANAP